MNLVMYWPICSRAASLLKTPMTVLPNTTGVHIKKAVSTAHSRYILDEY